MGAGSSDDRPRGLPGNREVPETGLERALPCPPRGETRENDREATAGRPGEPATTHWAASRAAPAPDESRRDDDVTEHDEASAASPSRGVTPRDGGLPISPARDAVERSRDTSVRSARCVVIGPLPSSSHAGANTVAGCDSGTSLGKVKPLPLPAHRTRRLEETARTNRPILLHPERGSAALPLQSACRFPRNVPQGGARGVLPVRDVPDHLGRHPAVQLAR